MMDDYKKMYELLHMATSKAIETLQNALIDIENMNMQADEELLPGDLDGANPGVMYAEEKE